MRLVDKLNKSPPMDNKAPPIENIVTMLQIKYRREETLVKTRELFIVVLLTLLICLIMPTSLIADNSETINDIIIDKTSPALSVETVEHKNGEYTSSVTVNITDIVDSGNQPSGVEKLEYSLDGGINIITVPKESFTGNSYSFDVTDTGHYTLSVIAIDRAGNSSGSHDKVKDPNNKFELTVHGTNIYIVTFKDYDGTVIKQQSVAHGSDATAPEDPIREGYVFTGWDKSFTNVISDLTVIAQYTQKTYTVTFRDYDNTIIKTEIVSHGESAIAPTNPSREGHVFIGWDKDFSNVTSDLTVIAQYSQTNTSPVITVLGENPVYLTQGDTYTDAGATAFDAEDGDITADILITNLVDTTRIGTYTVTYSVTDSGGLTITKTRTVIVNENPDTPPLPLPIVKIVEDIIVDKTVPSLNFAIHKQEPDDEYDSPVKVNITDIMDGGNPASGVERLEYSLDGGVTTIEVTEGFTDGSYSFEIAEVGEHILSVIAIDRAGNVSGQHDDQNNQIKLTIRSVNTPPVIKLLGENPITLIRGETYTDPGATATDAEDGDLTDSIAVEGIVDTEIVGTYTITYTVTDSGGLTATKTRTIIINDHIPPDIGETTSTSVTLMWGPVDKAICYKIKYINNDTKIENVIPVTEPYSYVGEKITYTVTDLEPNTYYTFWIIPVFADGTEGSPSDPIDVTTKQEYSITYEIEPINGGTLTMQPGTAYVGKEVKVIAKPNDGYYFEGWYENDIGVSTNKSYTFIMPAKNIHLKAKFGTTPTYSLILVANPTGGGTLNGSGTYKEGTTVNVSAVANEGYSFSNWTKEEAEISSNAAFPYTITNEDVTLVANFNINTYTVVFIDHDETLLKTETVPHGKSATAPANPTREGYNFIGWDKDFSKVTSDLTVTAQYSQVNSPKGTVTIHYQDSEGNTIKDSDVYTNVEGTNTYVAPDIVGYVKPAVSSVTFTITTDGQVESYAFIYGKAAILEGLNIIPAQATIKIGDTIQFKVELVYSDGTKHNISASDVNWSIIQGDDLVSITDEGLLTTFNIGSAEVGAIYIDKDMNLFSAYADVSIIAPIIQGTVTIKYQDINGNIIKSSDLYENVTGEKTYYAPNIDGYKLIGEDSITFIISTNEQIEEHVFVYSKKSSGGSSRNPSQPDPVVEEPEEPIVEDAIIEEPEEPIVKDPIIEEPEKPIIEEHEDTGVQDLITEEPEDPIKNPTDNNPINKAPVNYEPGKIEETEPVVISDNKTENNKIGMVTGKIVKDDGTPMSNVKVELHSEIRTTFTNKNGEFKFRNVPLGMHELYLVDDRLRSGKALIGQIKVIANTNNVTPINNKDPGKGIVQCVLADDKPVADLVIKVDTKQLTEDSRVTKPTIFGSIKPTTAIATTAVAALAATLLIVLVPRRRRKKEE